MEIRALKVEEAGAYVALRREMLLDSPWAYAVSEAEGEEVIAERVRGPQQVIVGAWDGETLVGVAGMYRERHAKMAHRTYVWGVYVTPRARGCGLASGMVVRLMEMAREWPGVTSVALAVSEKSPAAQRVYERLGFRAWGREPGAAVIDGRAYDEIHMVCFLDQRGAAATGAAAPP